MHTVVKDLIKYEGISSDIGACVNQCCYKQTHLDGVQWIPMCKPSIDQIIRVKGQVEIIDYEIVQTPVGVSAEGQELTGEKMFVVGEFRFKVEYQSRGYDKEMHVVYFLHPFCEYIVMPRADHKTCYMYPTVAIEDLYVRPLDEGTIFYNTTLLLAATLY
ncbi:MAG: DUF3794 domain-containing protein [Cellulosilyticaceae bacterium]